MAGILLIISIISMHLSDLYSWDYEASDYQFEVNGVTYDLENPSQRWDLPAELEENSGLSFYRKNQLACIEDEKGIFYVYNLKKKEIIRRDQFGDYGDYEAVEVIRDTAYVLKSNGTVYYFQLKDEGIGEVNELKTDLTSQNDTEGLGFNHDFEEVLIGCKENPGTKKVDIKKSRSIYRIELATKKFKKKPRYIVDGKSYNKMLEKKDLSNKKHTPFKPSGVAVHPKNNFIFIIGSVGKMLIILNPEGEIENLIPLDPKIFWQPEGICFSPNGDLYISSEGRGKKGYILKF
jgi:uncharacterized protein YjiK